MNDFYYRKLDAYQLAKTLVRYRWLGEHLSQREIRAGVISCDELPSPSLQT